jgi:hypothetical protein
VRASPAGLFYVADTEGNAVIIFLVTRSGPRQVGDVGTEPGTRTESRSTVGAAWFT